MLRTYAQIEELVRGTANRTLREAGSGIVEYLLLVIFIALALVVFLAFFAQELGNAISVAGTRLPT